MKSFTDTKALILFGRLFALQLLAGVRGLTIHKEAGDKLSINLILLKIFC
jgi:hypothetical protein